jgi:cathepsin L
LRQHTIQLHFTSKDAAVIASLLGANDAERVAVESKTDGAFTEEEYQMLFGKFVGQFNKKYTHDSFFYRYTVFKSNMDFIHAHNTKANASYTLGMNDMGDMTNEEFAARNGFKHIDNSFLRSKNPMSAKDLATPTATSVDWRTKGAVTPIKNQQQCGSCWAFSSTGSMEGAHQIKVGKLVSLSEQQLVDCSQAQGNQGCEGGLMDQAFEYVISNGGITSEKNYPYTAQDGTCMSPLPAAVTTLSSFTDITSGDESGILTATNIGPVSIAIEADSQAFQFYSGGVFNDPTCGTNLDHGVLVVGYGTDGASKLPYWIVKNSWGVSWGEQGYIRMIRGQDECGMATVASYPVV